jgi:proline dehydrogenase
MLRRLLLYLSSAGWAKGLVTHFFLARRVAHRFVAGDTLEQAIVVIKTLNEKGLLTSLDYLGESVHNETDTQDVVAMYRQIINAIHTHNLNASVSLKLTHLGLDIEETLCVANLRVILDAAQDHHIPVTIDMESSDYTDVTLKIYRAMRDDGFDNAGTVIQTALRRSSDDMRALAQEGARIRLCKGAYLEPEEIAFPDKDDVDDHYLQIVREFMSAPAPALLESATHDEAMIQATLKAAEEFNVPPERFEIQMLYGIRTKRQEELAAAGVQMRVYVPFGTSWYSYFMRRLAERPANLWFFMRSLFRR